MGRKYSKRKNKRLFIQANLLERKRERRYREARQEGVDPIILDPDEVEEPKEEPKEEEPKKKPQPQSKVVKYLRSRYPKRSEKYKNYSEPEWRKLIEEGKSKTNKTDDSIIPLNALDEEMKKAYQSFLAENRLDREPTQVGLDWEEKTDGEVVELENLHDHSPLQMLKKFKRPYFSPKFNSFEVDLAFFKEGDKLYNYIFFININTRKLYAIPIGTKDSYDLEYALKTLVRSGVQIDNFRSDAESGLRSDKMKDVLKKYDIKHFYSKSPFTQKNRIVDRVIRTIRDNLYRMKLKSTDFNKKLQACIYHYNNSFHKSIGMKPVQMTYFKEKAYIEKCKQQLAEVHQLQKDYGFWEYKPGDKIKVYLDNSKTNDRFKKRRHYYTTEATFIEYVNGNVKCQVGSAYHIVPIYYTVSDEVNKRLKSLGVDKIRKLRVKPKKERHTDLMERRKLNINERRMKEKYNEALKQWEEEQLRKAQENDELIIDPIPQPEPEPVKEIVIEKPKTKQKPQSKSKHGVVKSRSKKIVLPKRMKRNLDTKKANEKKKKQQKQNRVLSKQNGNV